MKQMSAHEFGKVIPLFHHIDHSIAIVYSVLERNSPGRVFVDDLSHPCSVFLFPEGTYFYVAGNEKDESFCQSLSHLLFDEILPNASEKEMVLFAFSSAWRDRLDTLLMEKRVIRIHRKVFDFSAEKFAAYCKKRVDIPEGMYLRLIDAELAERNSQSWSMIDPASRRFGYCLMNGEDVVSECSSIYVGGGEAEIDIHTAEEYRGRGYAQVVASAFIQACQQKGLKPNWACWPERQASIALAKKLGFEEKADVPVHLWVEGM
ncbi:MAG TPA: GNAT family N-acetyltransferase [Anaerolineales bacterium]|nr:GNAT family N-acetyltransferase [Anaerolineales bacterium]